jgi:hypothetical protein
VGGQITQFGDGAFGCLLDAGHFVAPSGLIGIESVPRNVERYAGHLAGIGPLTVFCGRYI